MLMKWGLFDENLQPTLSAYQVAAIRIASSGLVMIPFLPKALKGIPKNLIFTVLLSGWLGSFFAAFLFCIAETKIDGALAGSLNALTPIFVIITGALFFKSSTSKQKINGVIIGLVGCALLTYANYTKPVAYIAYIGLVILATFFYGLNVNVVQRKLHGIGSTAIAAVAFVGLLPFALVILFYTGYFNLPLSENKYFISTLSSSVLGILGTAIASILFYMLVKREGGLFASLVTYGVPFVAIAWGIFYKEEINVIHVFALSIILLGVYIANKQKSV